MKRQLLLSIGIALATGPLAEAATADTPPHATLIRHIPFTGFATNEVYPFDLDGDGRFELLCLQSAGLYQSKVFNGTKYERPAKDLDLFCLTALTLEGKVLWQVGQPFLGAAVPASHVADQMVWPLVRGSKREVAVLRKEMLLILDAATGAIVRSTNLGADNYAIIRGFHTASGPRLLIENTDTSYPPYEYGGPALIYDAATLRRVAVIGHPMGGGHSPRPLDIDGDGTDELLIGFDAYDADGRRLWTLEGTRRPPTTKFHVDQLQVGRLDESGEALVVYAASGDVEIGTLRGKLRFKKDFGHAQHVVLGNFKVGAKTATIAIYCCYSKLGEAQMEFLERTGRRAPIGYGTLDTIAFLDSAGTIVNLVFPGMLKYHSGEGILVYPQGCADGGDAVLTRDWGWPQALEPSGKVAFVLPEPKNGPAPNPNGPPTGPGSEGHGIRVADFDGDGRADILVHDQANAWIYQPPFPAKGAPNTHSRLQPITGQGFYKYIGAKSK